jgi:hypothetical protein
MAYEPPPDPSPWRRMSAVVVAVGAPGDLDFLSASDGWERPAAPPASVLWTDQRSDILHSIRLFF